MASAAWNEFALHECNYDMEMTQPSLGRKRPTEKKPEKFPTEKNFCSSTECKIKRKQFVSTYLIQPQ